MNDKYKNTKKENAEVFLGEMLPGLALKCLFSSLSPERKKGSEAGPATEFQSEELLKLRIADVPNHGGC